MKGILYILFVHAKSMVRVLCAKIEVFFQSFFEKNSKNTIRSVISEIIFFFKHLPKNVLKTTETS